MKQPIYLDNASTTPIAPEVVHLMSELFSRLGGNPASQHQAGRQAHAALEDAKDRIKLALLGQDARAAVLDSWRVVITSGGTEANNLAIYGLGRPNSPIFTSPTEHPSLLVPATFLIGARNGSSILDIISSSLALNIDVLEERLAACERAAVRPLVSVMLGNNETGLVNDLQQISRLCRRHGAILHSDCVQAVGKLAPQEFVPFLDAMTISAHKLHGPVGVGALLVRSNVDLRPQLMGGSQQFELRPGTESVPLTAALALALEMSEHYRESGGISQIAQIRDHFEKSLQAALGATHLSLGASHLPMQVIGASHFRLPHISSIAFPGRDRQALLMALDLAGVQCSTGSACASGSSQPSHVLTALGLPPEWIASTLRFSFSRYTTLELVDEAVSRIANVLSASNRAGRSPP